MNDLRFYDFDFNLIHIQHDISGVHWNLRYNGIGSFEAEFSPQSKLCALCMKNHYLIVCQGEMQALITGKFIKDNKFTLYGRTINFLLDKRIAPPLSYDNKAYPTDPANMSKYIVEKNCSDFVSIGNIPVCLESVKRDMTRISSVYDAVYDLLESVSLGHRLYFDTKNQKWVFDILKGEEKNLIICEDLYNVFDCEYSHSLLDYFTSGYYSKEYDIKGDWNPQTNTPTLYNNVSENYGCAYRISEDGTYFNINFLKGEYLICNSSDGAWEKSNRADSYWIYKNGTTNGAMRWDAILDANNGDEAKKILDGSTVTEKISARIKKLEYGKDFNLGDIIRFTGKFGNETVTFNLKITSVNIWYETSYISGIKPEFIII